MDNIIFMSEIVDAASNINNITLAQLSNIESTSIVVNDTLNILNKLNNTINSNNTEVIIPRQQMACTKQFYKNDNFVNNVGTGAVMAKIDFYTSNSEKATIFKIKDNTQIYLPHDYCFICNLRYQSNGTYWFGPIPIVNGHTYSFWTFSEVEPETTIQFYGQKIKQDLTLISKGSAV